MNQTVLAQAYSRLKALKANLPERYHADQAFIEEFHNVLDMLQKESGHDLTAFRVPAGEMTKESTSSNTMTGEVNYTGRMECLRAYLLMRIDGVLGFFTLSSSKTAMGFTPS